MKATIRQQVKENFQSMEFSKAMEVNNELKSEYIRVCGQRSWVSLVNYYSKKAAKEQPEAEQQPEETAVEQPEVQEPVAEVKELSPVMKQYRDLKEQHPDAVLLFRVGDFYETYGEDAETASQILGIVLTTRNTDGTKMAGFPHHALDTYLPKLVRAGKRIAICDQLEDPKLAKKVKRGITELVTPGMAEEKQAETPIEEEASQEPTTEAITSEEVGTIEDIITPTEEPAKEETYKFTVSESFNLDAIRQLVESGQPILNQFCIIHEFFKRVSDTETVRYTRMFVKADGEGWKLYDEGSAVAKKNELKSYRKLGYFDQSNDGFPVGEEYSQITVMRIKKALEKFVLGRSGATQVTSVMTVAI